MRSVVVAVMATGCSLNDKVPARPDAQRIDAPAAHDAPAMLADSRLDAFFPMPDARPDARPDAPPDSAIDAPPDVVLVPGDLYPDAPTAAHPGWQSLQERFHHGDGTACTGQVTVAVGDRAVCYVGTDDDIRCAGSIYTHQYGTHFTAIGQPGVDQIWLGMTTNSATGNAICVHKRAGTVWCMGDANSLGQFGNGTTSPSAAFTQFGSSTTLVRMGGDWNTRCVLDAAGTISCAGYLNHSSTPVQQPGMNHTSFYVTNFGALVVDDPTFFRQSNNGFCEVHADGLECHAPMTQALSGYPGQVVDGGTNQALGGSTMGDPLTCWLEPTGIARCGASGIQAQVFASAPPILALATNFYTDDRCAVANDGSLWCSGTNANGELGTGTTSLVRFETMVAPPGSVKIDCH